MADEITDIELYDRLTMLSFRLSCGVHLLDVIYECMNSSKYETDAFTPAIYAAYEYLAGVEHALECLKKEKSPIPAKLVNSDEN